MRVLVVGGVAQSLVNFRGTMLRAMVAAGHEVHACAGDKELRLVEQVESLGVTYHPVELERRGLSLRGDLRYFQALRSLIQSLGPDLVLAYTIKPIVYGALAARASRVPRVAAMISGAGLAQPATSLEEMALAGVARSLYGVALRCTHVVFFQNPDDEALFRRYRLLGRARVVPIAGSGVDLAHFAPAEPVASPVTFLLIARLLGKKGVREYVRAAEILRSRYGDGMRCLLAGPMETGPDAVSSEEVEAWRRSGAVEYVGVLDDVRPTFRQASVYVLPSYREGTPRTVLEAMAMARPIVTTTAAGCRETIVDGQQGFLVPPRDSARLADRMARFIENPSLIETMGLAARARAEEKYDVHQVNRVILEALDLGCPEASAPDGFAQSEGAGTRR